MGKVLFDERPLIVPIETATALGLEEAIILQQVHYWLLEKAKAGDQRFYHNDKYWIYNTYEDWKEKFPFWSISTIRRKIGDLEKSGLLETANFNESATLRTKWYTINYELLSSKTHYEQMERPNMSKCNCSDGTNATVQNEQMEMFKVSSSRDNIYKEDQTKTTSKITSENTTKGSNIQTKKIDKTDKFCGHEFSEPMKEELTDWLTYKAERKESYKPTGLKSFMSEISNKLNEYTEKDVISLISECMANNWRGIIWDKLKGKEKPPKPVDRPIPHEILREKERHEEAMKKFRAGLCGWEELVPR